MVIENGPWKWMFRWTAEETVNSGANETGTGEPEVLPTGSVGSTSLCNIWRTCGSTKGVREGERKVLLAFIF